MVLETGAPGLLPPTPTQNTHPPAVSVHVALGQAKVGDAHVAVTVKQHVLRLQVTVHDAAPMEVRQRSNDLGGVQTGNDLVKDTLHTYSQRQQEASATVHDATSKMGRQRSNNLSSVRRATTAPNAPCVYMQLRF